MCVCVCVFCIIVVNLHRTAQSGPVVLISLQYAWDSKKNKNEQIAVGHFCGKHAMGAKKNG